MFSFNIKELLEVNLKELLGKVKLENQVEEVDYNTYCILFVMQYYSKNSKHDFYLNNLLNQSLNCNYFEEVHPSFVAVIQQLSEDELTLLEIIDGIELEYVGIYDYDGEKFHNYNRIVNPRPEDKLRNPSKFNLYCDNLIRLDLITWPMYKQEPIIEGNNQTGLTQYSKIKMTRFGQLFMNTISKKII